MKPGEAREEITDAPVLSAEADLGTMKVAFRAARGGKAVEVMRTNQFLGGGALLV